MSQYNNLTTPSMRFHWKYICFVFAVLACIFSILTLLMHTISDENFLIRRTLHYHAVENQTVESEKMSFDYAEIKVVSSVNEISDILDSKKRIAVFEKSIFFHETSSSFEEKPFSINQRQTCAIESAAKTNPNTTIYLLFSYPTGKEVSTFTPTSEKFVKELLKYDNVRLGKFNMEEYLKDTPMAEWYSKGALLQSRYLIVHTSDLIRLVTLWKFGGTYMDLDVVVMKSVEPLGENFAGAESKDYLANGILNFDLHGIGHEIVDKCLREFAMHFNGQEWGSNGPTLITNILKSVCKTNDLSSMDRNNCKGFIAYPPSVFYPISWPNWHEYFKLDENNQIFNKIKLSYTIHVWNKLSAVEIIQKSKANNVPYAIIAKSFCPNTYSISGDHF